MKTFYATAVIFLLLLGVVWGNKMFVDHMANDLEQALSDLPPCTDAEEAVRDLQGKWEDCHPWVGLSVSSEVILQMYDRLAELTAAVATQNAADFERARALAKAIVSAIRDTERLGLDNLL